jgi:hypothetical protein
MAALLTCCSPDQGRSSTATAILVHEMPRRMRFVVPALKGDHARAAALCERLLAARLVQTADFNPITGSVVVTHDQLVGTRDAVLRALRELGYSATLSTPFSGAGKPRQRDVRGAAFVAKAALHFILDHALESAIVAIL